LPDVFTGIVEQLGSVSEVRPAGPARTLRIEGSFDTPLANGESVSVNGVCLTVERADASWFEATAVHETLQRTALGDLRAGSQVNLERAATLSRLFGGHIVQGHVDGVGRVMEFEGGAGERTLMIEVPEDVHELCAEKGSITIDGISLTVARKLPSHRIEIAIVPFTLEHTIVGEYAAGRRVNVEADVIARYVREQLRNVGENSRR
jgi:riboflavin synthase